MNTIQIIEDVLKDIDTQLKVLEKDEENFSLDLSVEKEKLFQKKIVQENHLKNLFNEIYSIPNEEEDISIIENIVSQNFKYIQALKENKNLGETK